MQDCCHREWSGFEGSIQNTIFFKLQVFQISQQLLQVKKEANFFSDRGLRPCWYQLLLALPLAASPIKRAPVHGNILYASHFSKVLLLTVNSYYNLLGSSSRNRFSALTGKVSFLVYSFWMGHFTKLAGH